MTPRSVTITLAAAAVLTVAVVGWWAADGFRRGKAVAVEPSAKPASVRAKRAASEVSSSGKAEVPAAMSNVGTYAVVRLKEIKANPELLGDVDAWRQEWAAAKSPELKREVLGLATQVGPDAYLAVLPEAIDAESDELQMEAVRSLALLPEDRLREGVAIAVNAGDEETRAEAMEVIGQLDPRLQPPLVLTAVQVGGVDVQKLAIGMVLDRPSPEMFEVLLQGLRSDNPESRPLFDQAIVGLVQQRFDSYEEATKWWSANRESFDSMMLRAQ